MQILPSVAVAKGQGGTVVFKQYVKHQKTALLPDVLYFKLCAVAESFFNRQVLTQSSDFVLEIFEKRPIADVSGKGSLKDGKNG